MQKRPAGGKETVAAVQPKRNHTISKLGRLFGLSRSSLLYYDRIGLLNPSGRTRAGYRCYTEADRRRLERICGFRQAGVALADIRTIIASGKPSAEVLERRFHEIGEEIRALKAKQGILARLLAGIASAACPPRVDRELWVEMLRAAGMDDRAMMRWHAEFEQRAPEAHREFLLSLGIPEGEALEIQQSSRPTSAGAQRIPAGPDDTAHRRTPRGGGRTAGRPCTHGNRGTKREKGAVR